MTPDVGDEAPDFTLPVADGDTGASFTLSDRLDEGPTMLAFFPGAFTGVCTGEMQSLRDHMPEFENAGGVVYGISVDSPFALNEFRDQNDLPFALLSDFEREVIETYDISMDFADLGLHGLAKRSVFVVDTDGTVTYAWVSNDPGREPDYDELVEALSEAA
jgi:peroxiredoxin